MVVARVTKEGEGKAWYKLVRNSSTAEGSNKAGLFCPPTNHRYGGNSTR